MVLSKKKPEAEGDDAVVKVATRKISILDQTN
jgi:hypothetical protein